jgi:TonB family protein
MSRRWLVAVSVVAHAAVGVGLVASGLWRIERLEAGRVPVDLVRPMAPPEPAPGGPVAAETLDFKRKEIVKTPRQPVPKTDKPPEVGRDDQGETELPGDGPGDATAQGTCRENCGETPAPALAPVCGDRSVDISEQCDDGNTASGDGCSSTCRIEPRPVPGFIAPKVLQGLRISGETQVHPSTSTQHQMMRNDHREVTGVVRLCLATSGSVASASMQRSTTYPDYDETILTAVRRWRYQPYTVNGTPVPACSTVTFLYSIRSR